METRIENHAVWRRLAVVGILVLAFSGLMWRAIDLQLNHKDFLQTEGNARYLRVMKVLAHRGKILDRNGYPLAISTPVDSVWANPRELRSRGVNFNRLVKLLGLDGRQLQREIQARKDREFIFLKRQLDPALAARVMALGIEGVYLQREYRRYYPMGEVAAHVVGFTNVDDMGQEGIELTFEELLRGKSGSKRVLRDRIGQIVADVERIRAPKSGQDLVLSMDKRIQYLAYRRLLAAVKHNRARAGSAVVLDARTGEVLAMVNQPSYNPNNRSDRVGSRFRNRAVTDVFEPGSTTKPFTIAAALGSGRFDTESVVDTAPGHIKVGKYVVKDSRNHGKIDLGTIVKKSSNVGASKIALALPSEDLWQTFSRFGFGQVTGGGFPGEAEGVFTHYFEWGDVHKATLSYGYGISVTALQLARAYAAIANEGRLPRVTFEFVKGIPPAPRVISEDVALKLRRMLEAVISSGGTGTRAQLDGYRVAGKTGTVRKVTPGGYSEDRYVALFAGFAPMSAPRIVTVVVIDEPAAGDYYGGEVAAPVFADITEGALRLLGVAPDDRSLPLRYASAALPSRSVMDRIQSALAQMSLPPERRPAESMQ
ncbi:MAG: penicillin-binding protein 2 [Gammaproteobacteria bacterium]|nr:penicillin-binding protein 2 [Gammaproteobacteria bacterium]